MFVYSVKNKETGKIMSMKAGGGSYYTRRKDAENKIGNSHATMEVATFELVEVPISTIKEKGIKYCYKQNNKNKIYSTRNKSWAPDQFKMFKLVEVY